MANGADGSIIIDTGLDNTGFERGSQRMQQAIRGVTQAINQSGRAAANGMQPLFSACQQAGSSINAAAQSAETKWKKAGSLRPFPSTVTLRQFAWRRRKAGISIRS